MRFWFPMVILSLSIPFLVAQDSVSVPLLENSPFMPPGKADAGSATPDQGPPSLAKLQLRGITSIDGEYIFSVYNPDTRESKWIAQGESQDGLTIKSYDSERNSVVIHSESENLSRQMDMNDYAAPTALRPMPAQPAVSTIARPATPSPQPVTPTGTGSLVRTQQEIVRPTRRNLETLRARREELADKLRKQPEPTNNQPQQPQQGRDNGNGGQGNGGNR
jgi:hypothetical protein